VEITTIQSADARAETDKLPGLPATRAALRSHPLTGLLALGVLASAIELGWLALWPLSLPLSHNADFAPLYLATHPAVGSTVSALFALAQAALPGLTASPPTWTESRAPFVLPTIGFVVVTAWIGLIYLAAIFLLHRGRVGSGALGMVIGFGLLFQATLFLMPGLFSQDIFGYLAYGRVAAVHEVNPYIWPPSVFKDDPILPWVAPLWRPFPNPYGPVWTDVMWLVAQFTRDLSVVDQVLTYKVVSNALHLINLALVWRLSGYLLPRFGPARITALAVFAWNPLVLFEVAGNAHNDVFLLLLLLLALLAIAGRSTRRRSRQHAAAAALFTLSALVKYLSGLVLPLFAVAAVASARTLRGRVARLGLIGVAVGVVSVSLFAPWLELPDSLVPLVEQTSGVRYANSVPDKAALLVADHILVQQTGSIAAARDTARAWMKVISMATFLIYLAWELRQQWRGAAVAGLDLATLVRGAARVSLAFILVVSVWVQTWYFVLPLGLCAILGWRSSLTRATVMLSTLALPVFYTGYYLQQSAPDFIYFVYAAVPLGVLLVGRRSPSRSTRALMAAGATLLLTTGCAPALLARAHLVAAAPAVNSVVGTAPRELLLTFNRDLAPGVSFVNLTDAAGAPVSVSSESESRTMVAALPDLRDGTYRVRWHSVDAATRESLDGTYEFTVSSRAGTRPTVSLSRELADATEPLTVIGDGFTPESDVRLVIGDDDQALGTARVDRNGKFNADVVVPGSVPYGVQAVSAVDTSDTKASAVLQVFWGGWPPLGVWTVAEPGPEIGQVTFHASGRNRSDYVLEAISVSLEVPSIATFVSATAEGEADGSRVTWTLERGLDRTTFGPLKATFAIPDGTAVSARSDVEFRHRRPRDCIGDGCLPAFISTTHSESPPVRPR